MSTPTQLEQLHLILGDEEFLVDRAVTQVINRVRAAADVAQGAELPVNRLRAGDTGAVELAELLSPSLFAEDRVVVLEAAAEAGKEAVASVLEAAGNPPPGVVLIVVHSGGGRAKAMVGALEKLGAVVYPCAKPKQSEIIGFIRDEFRTLGVRVSADAVRSLFEGVGSNLRELAAACSQLAADTGGKIDVAAVQRYYAGKAAVSGFDVADLAVAGDSAGAVETLRWAMLKGVPHVVLADALADAVHAIARVAPAGRADPFRMASELGMPPWKIKKTQAVVKGWTPASVGEALRIVASLNAEVKGGAADPGYAVERAVERVAGLRKI
ncbi:DNA polymerase III subunit delta [Rhodococcus sp. NPDC049939]|uniref:DNA polymerase III subunit delta n=1 Tax=Rhodococcus sp. NPDC049939 TaxID=3155511 RepID=UPI0033FBC04C